MTPVLGVFFGVEFDGNTYVTIRVAVWPILMKTKSTCIIKVRYPDELLNLDLIFWKRDI